MQSGCPLFAWIAQNLEPKNTRWLYSVNGYRWFNGFFTGELQQTEFNLLRYTWIYNNSGSLEDGGRDIAQYIIDAAREDLSRQNFDIIEKSFKIMSMVSLATRRSRGKARSLGRSISSAIGDGVEANWGIFVIA